MKNENKNENDDTAKKGKITTGNVENEKENWENNRGKKRLNENFKNDITKIKRGSRFIEMETFFDRENLINIERKLEESGD